MNKNQKRLTVTLLSAAAFLCAGCSKTRYILTGTKRDPVPPEIVKVLQFKPANAEEIGIVWADADGKGQKAINKVMLRLKTTAGKLGANGIIIDNMYVRKGLIIYGGIPIPQDETSVNATAFYDPQ